MFSMALLKTCATHGKVKASKRGNFANKDKDNIKKKKNKEFGKVTRNGHHIE